MTLQEFGEIIRRRIPTPEEFVGVVESQGWKVVAYGDGKAALRGNKGDPLAIALAKMLSREPYRTNVLKLVQPVAEESPRAEEPKSPDPPPPSGPVREWLWRYGQTITECPSWGWVEDKHATGAWWWRWKGETEWRAVPGRNQEGLPPPTATS